VGGGLINARAETLDKKPSFQEAFKKRRCLIVTDGFYEWKREGGKKIPLYYYLKSGRPFALAGLYETWMSPDKKEIRTCAIITTGANELIAPVHDRMPVILTGENEKSWLQGNQADIPELKRALQPYPADQMDCSPGMGPHDLFFEK
jgi:putative SOS response-associated peptidase YedK